MVKAFEGESQLIEIYQRQGLVAAFESTQKELRNISALLYVVSNSLQHQHGITSDEMVIAEADDRVFELSEKLGKLAGALVAEGGSHEQQKHLCTACRGRQSARRRDSH